MGLGYSDGHFSKELQFMKSKAQNREVLKVNMIRDDKMTALNKAEWISALEYCHLYIQTD